MSPQKTRRASGVITFHTTLPASLLKSEECMADAQDATDTRKSPSQLSVRARGTSKYVRVGKWDETLPSETQPCNRQSWLSEPPFRRLQAQMEAENHQVIEIIKPLLDTENGLVKELESFLSQQDVAELRRRELQHKRWTEQVWFPIQKRVEEHVSRCSPVEAKRRQSLYSHYLHHCNIKGFVFLETCDLREYNPFLLNIKKPHYFKLSAAELKDLPVHERLMEKRTGGFNCKLPQSIPPFSDSVMPLLHVSVSASGKSPVKDSTKGRKTSSLATIPYSISATAQPDGRCHQTGCWFSRCGSWQHSASLYQSLSTSK